MKRVKQINFVFLFTILVIMATGELPLAEWFPTASAQLIYSQVIIALPSFLYLIFTKQSYIQAVGIRKVSLVNLLLLLPFTYAMQQVITFINLLSSLVAKGVIKNTALELSNENPFLLCLALMALLPAVLEESIFRGIFYQEYRKANPRGAIFLSALLFGLMHGNFNQFSYAFFMGIIFAFLIEATDSIVTTMFVHFCFNGASVVLLYIYKRILKNSSLLEQAMDMKISFSEVMTTYALRAVIFGAVAFFIYRQIAINCGRWEHVKGIFDTKTEQGEQKSTFHLFTWPLIVGAVILIISMILLERM